MPLYVFECNQGHRWEELQDIEGAPGESSSLCPTCREVGKKVPSLASVHFKGGGWTPKFYPNQRGH